MSDPFAVLQQIQIDTQTISELLFTFARDYLLPVFRKHPELPAVDISIEIANDRPGDPYITLRTHWHSPDPSLSVAQPSIIRLHDRKLT